tara:strand:+ start:1119 stop:1400 length:282 start_codon:yes stop_codon:yes gene_type:complete
MRGHICIHCKRNRTTKKYLCEGCLHSRKHNPSVFEASIRAYEAGRSFTTPKAHSPYTDAVRELARSIPTDRATRAAFVKAMDEADIKKGRGRE